MHHVTPYRLGDNLGSLRRYSGVNVFQSPGDTRGQEAYYYQDHKVKIKD